MMFRFVVLVMAASTVVACSGGESDDENQITRIDGPAVVDEDEARGNIDDPSDG